MRNKVLMFFLAIVCFATTFANNRPPGTSVFATKTETSNVKVVAATTDNTMMMSQTIAGCDINTCIVNEISYTYAGPQTQKKNEVMMIAYPELGHCLQQLCLPAIEWRFDLMKKIEAMMLKRQTVFGINTELLNNYGPKVQFVSSFAKTKTNVLNMKKPINYSAQG